MPETGLALSVVVCTRNRARSLGRTLDSLVTQDANPSQWEIVVVDNGSTDGTRQCIEEIRPAQVPVTYLYEPQPGLSRARNTGLGACSGLIVAYVDDDATVQPGWVVHVICAFDEVCPVPGVLGGKVLLEWSGTRPKWLLPRFESVYSALDYGDVPRFLSESEHIVGANMAFRRDVLHAAGGFESRLGRRRTNLLSGEETVVVARLRSIGLGVYYDPQVVVRHAVTKERQRRIWLWRRMFWDGVSQPRIDYRPGKTRIFYLRQAGYDLRCLCRQSIDLARAVAVGEPGRRTEVWLLWLQRAGRFVSHINLFSGS